MEALIAGQVKKGFLLLLLNLQRPISEKLELAIIEHLCNGISQPILAKKYGLQQSNIAREVARIRDIHAKVIAVHKELLKGTS